MSENNRQTLYRLAATVPGLKSPLWHSTRQNLTTNRKEALLADAITIMSIYDINAGTHPSWIWFVQPEESTELPLFTHGSME